MKKTIEHTTYNTETATKIATFDNNNMFSWRDSEYWHQTLYRTQKGKLFFHVGGGAFTQYAKGLPDGWIGGSTNIVPTTKSEAVRWAKESWDEADNTAELVFKSHVGRGFQTLKSYLEEQK